MPWIPETIRLAQAPAELQAAITEFWEPNEWDHAAAVAYYESGWRWDAELDTRRPGAPCGAFIDTRDGVRVSAEWSIGYFQINACNLPDGWNPAHLFNARQNAGTAHALWSERGWHPWYFSARALGLI